MPTLIILILYRKNKPIKNLNNQEYPWKVHAKLISTNNTGAYLVNQTEALLDSSGMVQFKNLGISESLSSFKIDYYLVKPIGIKKYVYSSIYSLKY